MYKTSTAEWLFSRAVSLFPTFANDGNRFADAGGNNLGDNHGGALYRYQRTLRNPQVQLCTQK